MAAVWRASQGRIDYLSASTFNDDARRRMARMVMCKKLGRELPAMTFKPFPNELGQRVFDQVSQEAWKMWLEHFKMIMNEYRLSPADPRTPQILYGQCEQFFFGPGADAPPEFKPQ
jgi:Fe-S cluster biosynthesis and repair protein YggX